MERNVGRLEQKEVSIACEILVPIAVLAGDRLSEVAVLRNDGDHTTARHPAPRERMSLQIAENDGKIATHAGPPLQSRSRAPVLSGESRGRSSLCRNI